MKFLNKNVYIIFFLLIILSNESEAFGRENNIQYNKKDISNYFSGIVSINQNHNNKAFKYLGNIQSIYNIHSQYNIEFLRTLVLLNKFREAFAFSKKVWVEDELFFEADLLMGLNSLIKKDYKSAEKYFERLNKISQYNLVFNNFIGNVLIAWTRASQGNEEES